MAGRAFSIIVLLSLSSAWLPSAWSQAGDAQLEAAGDTSDAVRFRLFQGEYTLHTNDSLAKDTLKRGVFKLDAETGQVWIYQERQSKDGTLQRKWRLIED